MFLAEMNTISAIFQEVDFTLPSLLRSCPGLFALYSEQTLEARVARVALPLLIGGVVGLAVGALASLPLAVTVTIGMGCGGLVSALFFCYVERVEEELFREPLAMGRSVLTQLEKSQSGATSSLQRVASLIDVISQREMPCFFQAYDNHSLHHSVTVVTDCVKGNASLETPWKIFLSRMQGAPVVYPDGWVTSLDFSLEMRRLEGKGITMQVEEFSFQGERAEEKLQELAQMERECFGKSQAWSLETLRLYLQSHRCLIMRCQETGKALGFLLAYRKERGGWHIAGLGRVAGAARLGVGEKLLSTFFERERPSVCSLEVRESNAAAIALYEKHGFHKTGTKPNYYSWPTEGADEMVRMA